MIDDFWKLYFLFTSSSVESSFNEKKKKTISLCLKTNYKKYICSLFEQVDPILIKQGSSSSNLDQQYKTLNRIFYLVYDRSSEGDQGKLVCGSRSDEYPPSFRMVLDFCDMSACIFTQLTVQTYRIKSKGRSEWWIYWKQK